MRINKKYVLVFLSLAYLNSPSAAADERGPSSDGDSSGYTLRTLHISDSLKKSSLYDYVTSAQIIETNDIQKRPTASLGDVLNGQAGVASTQFGPNAGRPVIRGLQGDRIRILQNGIGFLDASSASDDHAVAMDPFLSERIEIVRGPMTLLYGSSAVGGVVNVLNSRIHRSYVEGSVSEAGTQYSSNGAGQTLGLKTDFGFAKHWMLHIDGIQRKQGLSAVPGFTRSHSERTTNPDSSGIENKYRITNSENKLATGGLGLTYLSDEGYLGLSAQTFAQQYGTVAEPDVKIHMRQNRYDLDSTYRINGTLLREWRTKAAYTNYAHDELEGNETGTRFEVSGIEARSELVHQWNESVHGIFGLQAISTRFGAKGDEAYLPTARTLQIAPFVFEEMDLGHNTFNFGGRIEMNNVRVDEDLQAQQRKTANFQTASLSTGYLRHLNDEQSLGLNVSYNERAPTFQELFAYGEHIATGTFEIGSESLKTEKNYSAELTFKKQSASQQSTVSLFSQWFDRYIQLEDSGQTDSGSGLEIYNYRPITAQIYGLEFENKHHLGHTDETHWSLFERADYLIGINRSNGQSLARMTPPRLTVGVEAKVSNLTSDISVQHAFYQSRVSNNESTTSGYFNVEGGATYRVATAAQSFELYGRVLNILNQEMRQHVSLLKDLAPLPGRSFIFGARAFF